jgi:hypothetical protein
MLRILNNIFGGASARRTACTRPTTRLTLEQFDDRVLPSTTGVVSQVMDVHGNSVAFYIDNNHNLFASANSGQPIQIDSAGVDLQVSAGLDANGNAVAYVQNNAGFSLWALSMTVSGTNVSLANETFIDSNVQSFSAVMGHNAANGEQGGVFYVGGANNGTMLYQDGHGSQQVRSTGGDAISAGTDSNGNSVVYETAHWVAGRPQPTYYTALWEFYFDGRQWASTTIAGNNSDGAGDKVGYQVAGSVNGIVYFTDSRFDAILFDGAFHLIDGNVIQISAGTDWHGRSTLDYMYSGAYNPVKQFNYGTGGITTLWGNGNQDYITAGQGGHDYYVDGFYDTLTDRADFYYWTGHWPYLIPHHAVTETVIGSNVL